MDELLREIVARPDDDGVRAVLADALQAAGDPRGELISLQLLASRGNRDRDDRIRELLAAHATSWLGSLRDAARACRFDRGFPSRLELGGWWEPDDPRWETATRDPVLATVEELIPGGKHGRIYRRFLASSAMENLTSIEVFDRESLMGFAESTAPLTHVACTGFTTDHDYAIIERTRRRQERRAAWRRARGLDPHGYGNDGYVDDDDDDDLDAGEDETPDDTGPAYFTLLWSLLHARPTITSLAISETQLDTVAAKSWFRQIRALTIGVSGSTVRHHLGRWHQLGRRRLTVVPNAQLEPCDRDYPWDYKIEVIPDGDGAVATVSGEWMILPPYVLEALPAEVTRIEIIQASDERARRIRDVVGRPGVEVVFVPLRANNFVWEIR
jgi:uncharacterized protein (TIGR02996 family)